MIVRIMGEGQFQVDKDDLAELNRLDDQLGDAIDSGDDEAFRSALTVLLEAVRSAGTPVPDDELVHSDLVLPYADAHVDDVRAMLTEDGLIPG